MPSASPVTAAAALESLSRVFPWIGETEVALEYAGFTQPEVTRLLAGKRRAEGKGRLESLKAAAKAAQASPLVQGAEILRAVETGTLEER